MTDTAQIRSIVIATDFSENARTALNAAVTLASRHHALIHLVHAIDPDVPSSDRPAVEENIERSLRYLVDSVADSNVTVSHTAMAGQTWEVVHTAEARYGADLIVVGARGHNPISHVFLGSQADRIIRTADSPVLAIPPAEEGEEPKPFHARRILVATDFSESAERALSAALRLRHADEPLNVMLLHAHHLPIDYAVGATGGAPIAPSIEEEEIAIRAQLDQIAGPWRERGIEVEIAVRIGYPVTCIINEAKTWKADLIAVGTEGRTGWKHLFLGSVAERVLHRAPCPVLTVREPAPSSAQTPGQSQSTARV